MRTPTSCRSRGSRAHRGGGAAVVREVLHRTGRLDGLSSTQAGGHHGLDPGGILRLTNPLTSGSRRVGFGVPSPHASFPIDLDRLLQDRVARQDDDPREQLACSSTASSAGYSTGGTLISAVAAYILINNQTLPIPMMLGWVFCLARARRDHAIRLKRQMINIEQLRFPSGSRPRDAARAPLHREKAARAARALGIWGGLAALNQFWLDGRGSSTHGSSLSSSPRWSPGSTEVALGPAWIAGGRLSFQLGSHLNRRRHVRGACGLRSAS